MGSVRSEIRGFFSEGFFGWDSHLVQFHILMSGGYSEWWEAQLRRESRFWVNLKRAYRLRSSPPFSIITTHCDPVVSGGVKWCEHTALWTSLDSRSSLWFYTIWGKPITSVHSIQLIIRPSKNQRRVLGVHISTITAPRAQRPMPPSSQNSFARLIWSEKLFAKFVSNKWSALGHPNEHIKHVIFQVNTHRVIFVNTFFAKYDILRWNYNSMWLLSIFSLSLFL